jgi:hypothetical protein
MAAIDINDHKPPRTIIINPTTLLVDISLLRTKPLDSKKILHKYQNKKILLNKSERIEIIFFCVSPSSLIDYRREQV